MSSKNREGSLKQPGHQLHRSKVQQVLEDKRMNTWSAGGKQDWLSPSFESSTSQFYIPQTAFVITSKVTFWIAYYFSLPNPLLVSPTFSLNLNNSHPFSFHKDFKGSERQALSYSTLLPPLEFLVLHLYHSCCVQMAVLSHFQWASHSLLTRAVWPSSSLSETLNLSAASRD